MDVYHDRSECHRGQKILEDQTRCLERVDVGDARSASGSAQANGAESVGWRTPPQLMKEETPDQAPGILHERGRVSGQGDGRVVAQLRDGFS